MLVVFPTQRKENRAPKAASNVRSRQESCG